MRPGLLRQGGQRLGPGGEGSGEVLGVIRHRGAGGGADHARAVIGRDHHRAGRLIGGQVIALIGDIAVIEIGPVAKHRDPQPGQIVQNLADGIAGQDARLDHAPTCRIQSARL